MRIWCAVREKGPQAFHPIVVRLLGLEVRRWSGGGMLLNCQRTEVS